MMETLRGILADDVAVAALVGDRVHLAAAPDETDRPYVVLTRQAGQGLYRTVDEGLDTAWRVVPVEVACCGETYQAAEAVRDTVEAALRDYEGDGFSHIHQIDEYDAPSVDPAQTLFAVVLLYACAWTGP